MLIIIITVEGVDSNLYALQARWVKLLTKFLSFYRRKISVTLPWRPVYTRLRDLTERQGVEGYSGWLPLLFPAFLWTSGTAFDNTSLDPKV